MRKLCCLVLFSIFCPVAHSQTAADLRADADLRWHSASKASPCGGIFDAGSLTPIGNVHGFGANCDDDAVGFISCLFVCGRPTNIAREIPLGVVDSIYRASHRRISYVGIKSLEGKEFWAYSKQGVLREVFAFRVYASVSHEIPNPIGSRAVHPVNPLRIGGPVFLQTPAGLGVSILKRAGRYGFALSAGTNAAPHDALLNAWLVGRSPDDLKATKDRTGEV